jgi:hypothetical protein
VVIAIRQLIRVGTRLHYVQVHRFVWYVQCSPGLPPRASRAGHIEESNLGVAGEARRDGAELRQALVGLGKSGDALVGILVLMQEQRRSHELGCLHTATPRRLARGLDAEDPEMVILALFDIFGAAINAGVDGDAPVLARADSEGGDIIFGLAQFELPNLGQLVATGGVE